MGSLLPLSPPRSSILPQLGLARLLFFAIKAGLLRIALIVVFIPPLLDLSPSIFLLLPLLAYPLTFFLHFRRDSCRFQLLFRCFLPLFFPLLSEELFLLAFASQ